MSNTDFAIQLAGLALSNPLLPGSGPPGDSLAKLRKLQSTGIGGLVTKTISVDRPRVPKPCMAFEGDLFFNIEKWSEKTADEWIEQILPALAPRSVPLIVSLGYTLSDLQNLIPRFDALADGFEISTHYIADDPAQLQHTVEAIKRLTRKPVFIKLSAHSRDIVASAQAAEQGGADAITAINSIGPVVAIDIEKRCSRLGEDSPYAWLSGPAIKPIAMRCVYDISHAVRIPVIACGGVHSGKDVIEFVMAGATAVQSCTSLVRIGPEFIGQLLAELTDWCESHRVASLSELRGTAVPRYRPTTNIS